MSPSSSERELKFSPGPSFRMPDLDDAATGVRADAPDDASDLHAVVLRHRRPPARARGREPALPQRRRLDGEAPGRAADVALVRAEHPPRRRAAAIRPTPRARPRRRARRGAHRSQPVARAQHRAATRRAARRAAATQVAEVVDDEVSVLDGTRLVGPVPRARGRARPTAPADARRRRVAARLRAAGAGDPDPIPKIVRALGPRALDPPDVVAAADARLRVDRRPRSLRAAIAASTARLLANDPGVRLGERRRRTCTRPGSRPAACAPTCAPSGTLLDAGVERAAARRAEVARRRCSARSATPTCCSSRLEARLDELPTPTVDAGERLLDRLCASTRRARAPSCSTRCGRTATSQLLDRLVAAAHADAAVVDEPRSTLDDVELARPRAQAVEASSATRSTRSDDDPPDDELHEVRIRAKRCRYAAEAVAPAFGKAAQRFAKAVTDAPGRARRAPGRGRRRASGCATHAPTATDAESRSSPASSRPLEARRARRRVARRVAGRRGSGATAQEARGGGCEPQSRRSAPPAASCAAPAPRR